ncbi:YraN family protein [Cellulomonas dongxiuzhuiae]|uniref:YraN family protein n=1 Tax=Cellulomonas dongxiuzhuiae TaxID=2819979 RepID=UPI001AAF41EB|nr:YraN family protein [Cellulomonas dongxiuzhuiae]MBO3087560.1 YraN family protein [Cellulomonas dongxiuzhuiae]
MRAKDAVGRYGEDVATAFVTQAGWTVLARNWRCAEGELDIVALDGDEVVAIEVKTRRSAAYGHPAEAVTHRKLARLRRLTARWLSEHDVRAGSVRVDVIAVLVQRQGAARVEHLVGVV